MSLNSGLQKAAIGISATPVSSPSWRAAAWIRRCVWSTLVIVQTAIATRYILWVLPYHGGDLLEIGIAVLFTILFAWISVGFWTGVYGFAVRRAGGDAWSLLRRHPDSELKDVTLSRTAIVLPIYHEPLDRTFAGLRAMFHSLRRTGLIDYFDFFVLSDSRDPNVWLDEQAAWHRLCLEPDAKGRVFYRRRSLNLNYKSGNIADFCRRWGRNYRYTVVLDADSLMEGDTIVRMVRLMQLEPRIGILQSAPSIVNGKSLFARIQQFANQIYGPIFTTGLAALQLGEATYWGHNAILRTDLFMRHCGLRRLTGPGLFGGPILSHDYVEAAYMGKAGYEVWMEPRLIGSYEEFPPTLEDELKRDKRWAKGNFQHIWLMLFGRGIRLAHRLAFMNGVMSYLASPLWLLFLALGTVEVSRLVLRPIDYFPTGYSLFPVWPEWHPDSALTLFASTAVMLFLPKILAIIDLGFSRRMRRFGGFFAAILSVLLEILASAFLAPIRMLAHSRFVVEFAFNIRLKWAGQNRTEENGWLVAWIHQAPGFILGAAWVGYAFWLDEMFFYWSLPVTLPLILSAPASVTLGRTVIGRRLASWGLLRIPEETDKPRLLFDLSCTDSKYTDTRRSAFVQSIVDPFRNQLHRHLARPAASGLKRDRLEALRNQCLIGGPDSLSPDELSLIAHDRESLRWLHDAVWREPPDSLWAKLLLPDKN